MPVYEYECKCGNSFEKMLNIPHNTTKCSSCGDEAKRKVARISKSVFSKPTWNEDIDVIVGRDSEKRHKFNEKRFNQRQDERKKLGTANISVSETGEVVAASEESVALREVYSQAFKEDKVMDIVKFPEGGRESSYQETGNMSAEPDSKK